MYILYDIHPTDLLSWGSVVIFHRRFACFSLFFRSPFSIQGFVMSIKSTLLRYYLKPSCLFCSPKPIYDLWWSSHTHTHTHTLYFISCKSFCHLHPQIAKARRGRRRGKVTAVITDNIIIVNESDPRSDVHYLGSSENKA